MISNTLGMSKENLFYGIIIDYLQRHLIPIIEEAEQLPDPKERIAFVLKKVTLLNTMDKAGRVLIHETLNLEMSHYNEIVLIFKRAYDVVCNSIKELQQAGKARKFRESFQTFLGFGMTNWAVYWFDYGRQVNAEELAETVVQTFLNGLLCSEKEKR
jgi:AcrR family transcriptional regulator